MGRTNPGADPRRPDRPPHGSCRTRSGSADCAPACPAAPPDRLPKAEPFGAPVARRRVRQRTSAPGGASRGPGGTGPFPPGAGADRPGGLRWPWMQGASRANGRGRPPRRRPRRCPRVRGGHLARVAPQGLVPLGGPVATAAARFACAGAPSSSAGTRWGAPTRRVPAECRRKGQAPRSARPPRGYRPRSSPAGPPAPQGEAWTSAATASVAPSSARCAR